MDWPPGWRDVGAAESDALVRQFERELPIGHILFGRRFHVVARRDDQDDVLVELDDGEAAEMHLTWTKQTKPGFPGAILYVDLLHWREAQF